MQKNEPTKFAPVFALLKAAEESSRKGRRFAAVGAFYANFFSQVQGALEGLQRADAPGIIQVSGGSILFLDGIDNVISMINDAMDAVEHSLPVSLQLTHTNKDICKKGVDQGFSGILFNGGEEDYCSNVTTTGEIARYAHLRGVSVEGECGLVPGVEEMVSEGPLCGEAENALEFFRGTDVDIVKMPFSTSKSQIKELSDPYVLNTFIMNETYQAMKKEGLIDRHFLSRGIMWAGLHQLTNVINKLGGCVREGIDIPMGNVKEEIAAGLRKISYDICLQLSITAAVRKFFKENPIAETDPLLKKVKHSLDSRPETTNPRDFLGVLEPLHILRRPPEESGCQAFVDLMEQIRETVAQQVFVLTHELGSAGLAAAVPSLTIDDMEKIYGGSP